MPSSTPPFRLPEDNRDLTPIPPAPRESGVMAVPDHLIEAFRNVDVSGIKLVESDVRIRIKGVNDLVDLDDDDDRDRELLPEGGTVGYFKPYTQQELDEIFKGNTDQTRDPMLDLLDNIFAKDAMTMPKPFRPHSVKHPKKPRGDR